MSYDGSDQYNLPYMAAYGREKKVAVPQRETLSAGLLGFSFTMPKLEYRKQQNPEKQPEHEKLDPTRRSCWAMIAHRTT